MKGKKTIALFLILVFSLPLVPASGSGGLPAATQLQEEVIHPIAGKEVHREESDLQHLFPLAILQTDTPVFTSGAESIHSRQADDITTPPPNMQA